MAYVFAVDEPAPSGVKRVIRERLQSAAMELARTGKTKRGEAIHEARKSVKRTRAALRLVRGELGPLFNRENRRLRNVGHELAGFRDAAVAIETFEAVLGDAKLGENALRSIRKELNQYRRRSERSAGLDRVLKELAGSLLGMSKEVKGWPLSTDGFPAIEKGLKRSYGDGLKAMTTVHDKPTGTNYHEWRKRVKDHWYHVALLENLWTSRMKKEEESLKELETCLGDDHDLVVLLDRLHAKQTKYTKADLDTFLKLAEDRQRKLRKRAASLGADIYDEKPNHYAKRVEKHWKIWSKAGAG
jgi:CHAD domain-containing protein